MSETTLRDVMIDPKTYENVADHIPEKEEGKAYALRKMEAKDIAPMASILSKIGMKEIKACFSPDDIQGLASGKSAEDAAAAVGFTVVFDIAGVIFGNYEKCQDDIFKLLASLSGKSKEEIAKLPLDTFFEMIVEVVRKEEFKDFISVVPKLFK